MLTITFYVKPSVLKRHVGWTVHVGGEAAFLAFATKRSADEYLATTGREATRWVREINAVYRDVVLAGQGWACSMSTYDLIIWARIKADFDQRLADLAMRSKSKTPGHTMPKIKGLAEAVIKAAAHVEALTKVTYSGDKVALEMAVARMRQVQAEIERHIAPGSHGGWKSEVRRMA